MPQLHFVQELPLGASRKDQELERAKARAHAASVSYHSHHPAKSPSLPKAAKSRKRKPISGNVADGGLQQFFAHSFKDGAYQAKTSPSSDPKLSGTGQQCPHTLPESPHEPGLYPQRYKLSTTITFARDGVLLPPEALWSGTVDDADIEHVEDITSKSNHPVLGSSCTSTSSALLISTGYAHNVYQINPQYTTQSSQSPFNLAIPHDLLGTRADPFDCIPSRHAESSCVTTVRDYYAHVIAPNHAPIYKIFNVTNVYTTYYFELLTDPDFLYTGVASVQAIIDHLKRKPDEPVGPSTAVMKHIGTAMARLRRRLRRVQKEAREERAKQRGNNDIESHDPPSDETLIVDDMTIIIVLFLAVATRAINDLPSHEIHKATIRSLVSARGGLQNMTGHDGLARCTLMQWESFWALNTGGTIFPEARPTYNPFYPNTSGDVDDEVRRKVMILPEGFQTLAKQGRLALDVIEVLSRTAAAHDEQARHGTIVTPSDVFRTKPRKFRDFWGACTCLGAADEAYILVAPDEEHIHVAHAPGSGDSFDGGRGRATMRLPNLEKLLTLALLLYCLHTFSPMRAVTAVYNGSRVKLTTDVPRRARRPVNSRRRHPRPSTTTTSFPPNPSKCPHDHESEPQKVTTEESLLLWISFVLVDSYRAANDKLLPQGLDLMRDLRIRFPEYTRTWTACEAELKRFFWNEKFLRRCRRYWEGSESDWERERIAVGVGMCMENG